MNLISIGAFVFKMMAIISWSLSTAFFDISGTFPCVSEVGTSHANGLHAPWTQYVALARSL
jgi:hypothetical protein